MGSRGEGWRAGQVGGMLRLVFCIKGNLIVRWGFAPTVWATLLNPAYERVGLLIEFLVLKTYPPPQSPLLLRQDASSPRRG